MEGRVMDELPGTLEPRTWAEVNLAALRHNARAVRAAARVPVEILAVVKANAYGHGAGEVAAALRHEVEYFGVASVEEALRLEGLGPQLVLLSPCLPGERPWAAAHDCIATVSSAAEAAAFPTPCRLNFKIDTGMGRIGCPVAVAERELGRILAREGVTMHSISTHLPSADEDPAFTRDQLARFDALRERLRPLAPAAKFHVLNSAGVFGFSSHAGDIVRAGLALYGSASPPTFQQRLRPVLTWKTRVLLVRELPAGHTISYGRTYRTAGPTRTAVIAAGYADGYPRQASGRSADVLIGGVRRRVLGRITMDQIIVDATADPSPAVGDEVVLLGRQGDEEIPAAELAAHAGTIPWHLFTGLSSRVSRRYVEQP
jgi:alanine racemase